MPYIFTRKALPAFIACVLSSAAHGGTFTNHVGRSVSGQLTAITNGFAVIDSRSYPLSIFPESEQARMRGLLEVPQPLPYDLVALRRSYRERLLRNEALLRAGAKTPEAAAAQRAKLEAAWRRALDEAGIDINDVGMSGVVALDRGNGGAAAAGSVRRVCSNETALQTNKKCEGKSGEFNACHTGAHVWSWKPSKANGAEILFMPENAPWGKEVHGGIPICWPWFGAPPEKGMPKHGIARYATWKPKERDGKPGIAFELDSNEETMRIWPHNFHLEVVVEMEDDDKLRFRLVETNTGKEPFDSAWGFHPYFRVDDAERVAVDGEKQPTPSVRVQSSAKEKGRRRTLEDLVGGRTILVEGSDNEDWFVWNPGVDRTPLCETLGPDEWRRFYCVEPCTLVPRTLAPSESRVHEMTVMVK